MDGILELDVQADGNGMVHLPVGQPYAHVHVSVRTVDVEPPDVARRLVALEEVAAHFARLGITEQDVEAEIEAYKAERAEQRRNKLS